MVNNKVMTVVENSSTSSFMVDIMHGILIMIDCNRNKEKEK
jgi:hypothetical protein